MAKIRYVKSCYIPHCESIESFFLLHFCVYSLVYKYNRNMLTNIFSHMMQPVTSLYPFGHTNNKACLRFQRYKIDGDVVKMSLSVEQPSMAKCPRGNSFTSASNKNVAFVLMSELCIFHYHLKYMIYCYGWS